MIWENTKLLLRLLYRPVSSMGRIVDEGHWLYAAVVVAALSMVFHATVTSVIYNNYEAVYRDLPAPENTEEQTQQPVQPRPGMPFHAYDEYADDEDLETSRFQLQRSRLRCRRSC